jgi:hypothetical protein
MSEHDDSNGRVKQLSLAAADVLEAEPAGPALSVVGLEDASSDSEEETSELSATRRALLRTETDPQMVLVRMIEDARWAQRRARKAYREVDGDTTRLNVLKLFWSVRADLVKLMQGLGVLPRELFFQEEESDFDHVPAEVAEAVSGLLSGRLEPKQAAQR